MNSFLSALESNGKDVRSLVCDDCRELADAELWKALVRRVSMVSTALSCCIKELNANYNLGT